MSDLKVRICLPKPYVIQRLTHIGNVPHGNVSKTVNKTNYMYDYLCNAKERVFSCIPTCRIARDLWNTVRELL